MKMTQYVFLFFISLMILTEAAIKILYETYNATYLMEIIINLNQEIIMIINYKLQLIVLIQYII